MAISGGSDRWLAAARYYADSIRRARDAQERLKSARVEMESARNAQDKAQADLATAREAFELESLGVKLADAQCAKSMIYGGAE